MYQNEKIQVKNQLKGNRKEWQKPAIKTLPIQSGTRQEGPLPPPEGS